MNETHEYEYNEENMKTVVGVPLVVIENDKCLPVDESRRSQQDHYFDQEEGEETEEEFEESEEEFEVPGLGDGAPSPSVIKLKIKKSLLEFRCKIEDAILGNYLLGEVDENLAPEEILMAKERLRNISLWGVPLLPSKSHEGTDVVLTKFLKAKDFKVNEAFDMLQRTLIWRVQNKIDGILDEDLDSEFGSAGFLCSRDKEGRPVCYQVCGVFKDRHLYKKTFGSQHKCDKFLRWRIQLMEKAIMTLCFREGGAGSIVHVYDLKNTPMQGIKEFNSANKKILMLFQSYYPELTYKNIVVHAPLWFYTSQVLFTTFMSQRSKKRFILARPHKVTQILLKFIAPEHLPTEYGGLRRSNDQDFSPADKASELRIKASTVSRVEFPILEPGVTIMWDVTVLGWDVSYKEEFIPDDEGSYIILLQNQNIVGDSTRNSFYISEPGKIVITVENWTYKKKRMFYRSKTRTTVPMFILLS